VIVLDDWGLAVLSDENRRDVLELLEDRHGRRATLVTSQLPVEHWHEALGDPTLADAMLDRLVHNAYKLALKGDSMRKRLAIHTTDVPQEEPPPRGRFDTAHHIASDTGEDTPRAKPSQAKAATGHALGRHP
jgi:hypothetical protein